MTAITMLSKPDLPSLFQLAAALRQAHGFIPAHLRNEGEIVAVILAGAELGLPPMASMRSIALIRGKVILDASMQLALMMRAGAKVKWLKDGSDGVEAVLEVTREGNEAHVSRYTWEMAKQAGLTGNDTWKKHTAAMLRARAVSAAGKAYMPDVLSGVYVPGEIGEEEQQMQGRGKVVEAFPLARMETPMPSLPPVVEAEPSNVVQLREPKTELEPDEKRTVFELFATKLRTCRTHEALLGWLKKFLATEYPPEVREELKRLFMRHARACQCDPNLLVREAKKDGAS